MSQTSLVNVMCRLLNHLSLCNTLRIVMGDFNIDLLKQQNCTFLQLMSNFGYSQLVKSPTTAQGSLLDHVYCSNPFGNNDIVIQVQDTYYSDHDTVFCSIPFTYL